MPEPAPVTMAVLPATLKGLEEGGLGGAAVAMI